MHIHDDSQNTRFVRLLKVQDGSQTIPSSKQIYLNLNPLRRLAVGLIQWVN